MNNLNRRKQFFIGVAWMLGVVFFSALNDVLMRFGGERLAGGQVMFTRFFITLMTVVPFVLMRRRCLVTKQPVRHMWRSLLGTLGIIAGFVAVQNLPLSSVTTLFFVQPIFFLPLAHFFLKEHIGVHRISATLIGFLGVIIIGYAPNEVTPFNPYILMPLVGAFLFAVVDLYTKQMVATETPEALLFYFALGSTVFTLPFAYSCWLPPSPFEWFILLCLGVSANLIQLCLYFAFKATEASLLSPFKYTEVLFTGLMGFMFFAEIPTMHVVLGALLITLSNYYISKYEPDITAS